MFYLCLIVRNFQELCGGVDLNRITLSEQGPSTFHKRICNVLSLTQSYVGRLISQSSYVLRQCPRESPFVSKLGCSEQTQCLVRSASSRCARVQCFRVISRYSARNRLNLEFATHRARNGTNQFSTFRSTHKC